MIKNLVGTHEIVSYITESGFKLLINKSLDNYPTHWHLCAEIILPTQNEYTVQINNNTEILSPGDIIIIAPGELHSILAPKSNGKRIIIQYDFSSSLNTNEIRSFFSKLKPYCIVKANDNTELSLALQNILIQISDEYMAMPLLYESKICSLLIDFFVIISRSSLLFQEDSFDITHRNMSLYLSICDYINKNHSNDITLDDVVELSGFSKSHFCRFFKSYSGKSFYDYLLETRISHAISLLQCNENSILDISIESGFNSIATFNRVFKQTHNCTPNEYRKMMSTK